MHENTKLYIGLSVIGLTVGFMIGGSSTPVVGVAVPVLLALALPLARSHQQKNVEDRLIKLQELAVASESQQEKGNLAVPSITSTILKEIKRHQEKLTSPSGPNLGVSVAVLGGVLLAGSIAGAYARVWPSTLPHAFPWKSCKASDIEEGADFCPPSNLDEAIGWVALTQKLRALGYNEEQISMLYSIYDKEVKSAESIVDDLTENSTGGSAPVAGDDVAQTQCLEAEVATAAELKGSTSAALTHATGRVALDYRRPAVVGNGLAGIPSPRPPGWPYADESDLYDESQSPAVTRGKLLLHLQKERRKAMEEFKLESLSLKDGQRRY